MSPSGEMELYPADDVARAANPSLAFPIRFERGMFETTNERESYFMLLEIMARTPRGSWCGHPLFGFNEFFLDASKSGLTHDQRTRLAETTLKDINAVLADLGLLRYRVESLVFETTAGSSASGLEKQRGWNQLKTDGGATLILREVDTDRTVKYAL